MVTTDGPEGMGLLALGALGAAVWARERVRRRWRRGRWPHERARRRALEPYAAEVLELTRVTDDFCALTLGVHVGTSKGYREGPVQLHGTLVALPVDVWSGGPLPVRCAPRALTSLVVDYDALAVEEARQQAHYEQVGRCTWVRL